MTRRMLAVALTTLLRGSCFGQIQPSGRPSPKEQVLAILANRPVEVKFADGSKQRGRMGDVSETGFVLSHEKNHQIEKSEITFAQVKAVKPVNDVESHTKRKILIGVAIGVGAAVVVVVIIGAGLAKLQGRST